MSWITINTRQIWFVFCHNNLWSGWNKSSIYSSQTLLSKATYSNSYIRWWFRCRARYRPAHQELFGVQYLVQGHFGMQSIGTAPVTLRYPSTRLCLLVPDIPSVLSLSMPLLSPPDESSRPWCRDPDPDPDHNCCNHSCTVSPVLKLENGSLRGCR